MRYIM